MNLFSIKLLKTFSQRGILANIWSIDSLLLLLKQELDRKKHENLRNHKEEYFQNHLSLENNQRNSRLLKSFRQMSRMRTCLSDLDLSKTSDSEPEFVKPCLPFSKNSLFESNFKGKDKNHNLTVRPRSWTARDKQSQSPVLFKVRNHLITF